MGQEDKLAVENSTKTVADASSPERSATGKPRAVLVVEEEDEDEEESEAFTLTRRQRRPQEEEKELSETELCDEICSQLAPALLEALCTAEKLQTAQSKTQVTRLALEILAHKLGLVSLAQATNELLLQAHRKQQQGRTEEEETTKQEEEDDAKEEKKEEAPPVSSVSEEDKKGDSLNAATPKVAPEEAQTKAVEPKKEPAVVADEDEYGSMPTPTPQVLYPPPAVNEDDDSSDEDDTVRGIHSFTLIQKPAPNRVAMNKSKFHKPTRNRSQPQQQQMPNQPQILLLPVSKQHQQQQQQHPDDMMVLSSGDLKGFSAEKITSLIQELGDGGKTASQLWSNGDDFLLDHCMAVAAAACEEPRAPSPCASSNTPPAPPSVNHHHRLPDWSDVVTNVQDPTMSATQLEAFLQMEEEGAFLDQQQQQPLGMQHHQAVPRPPQLPSSSASVVVPSNQLAQQICAGRTVATGDEHKDEVIVVHSRGGNNNNSAGNRQATERDEILFNFGRALRAFKALTGVFKEDVVIGFYLFLQSVTEHYVSDRPCITKALEGEYAVEARDPFQEMAILKQYVTELPPASHAQHNNNNNKIKEDATRTDLPAQRDCVVRLGNGGTTYEARDRYRIIIKRWRDQYEAAAPRNGMTVNQVKTHVVECAFNEMIQAGLTFEYKGKNQNLIRLVDEGKIKQKIQGSMREKRGDKSRSLESVQEKYRVARLKRLVKLVHQQ